MPRPIAETLLAAPFAALVDDALATRVADWHEALVDPAPELAARLTALAAEGGWSWWRAICASEFLRRSIAAETDAALAVLEGAAPDAVSTLAPPGDAPVEHVSRALREHRRRAMLAIAWRDLAGLAPLAESLESLSQLADQCLRAALRAARHAMMARHGTLRDDDGLPVPLLVICMGKLGGRELNFSSDIDVVFTFPRDGESDGERPLVASEYCLREARIVIDLLDTNTAEGRVFRVDARLRPFGSAGPLAIGFDALENYLQVHGRDWERYAFVKARFVTADDADDAEAERFLESVVRPFVYRRYLDYGVLGSLRDMKAMISREVQRREMSDHLKLGPGGIREIEFIAQSLQLIRGGQVRQLRTPSLYAALDAIASGAHLPADTVATLRAAYDQLRICENRLQALDDRQVHRLPTDADARTSLALAMDAADWAALSRSLDVHRHRVAEAFDAMVFSAADDGDGAEHWLAGDSVALSAALTARDVSLPDAVADVLAGFRKRLERIPVDATSRERLERFLDAVVERLAATEQPAQTLERVLDVAAAVLRRSAYLALLNERPAALERLVSLAAISGFLTRQIAEHPMLLDALLDPRTFAEPLDRDALVRELDALEAELDPDDSEALVQVLARFARGAWFRIAVADVTGALPLMRVSDRLTDVAEIILGRVLDIAWADLVARHGCPAGSDDDHRRFAIVAYGKLGGRELGYGSDLDLVFLHDVAEGDTDGAQPVDGTVFVMRLARRVVHLLGVQTGDGHLYEVDTRLRPSGRSGLLVSSVAAFEKYQAEDAWTWEHQALTRARAVAGDRDIRRRFEAVRADILCRRVRRDTLAEDVTAMRRRMRTELSRAGAGEFDVKQDRGGIADLEFLVQYLVLRHACDVPGLLEWTDNIRQLDSLASAGVLDDDTARGLQDAYRAFRAIVHRRSLDRLGHVVDGDALAAERARVAAVWRDVFPGDAAD